MENAHGDKCKCWVGFSVEMAHRITAGCDILLMPSRFEPCGLNQLYAMRYGTVPVVHAVGGLRETVTPYNPHDDSGTGWQFDEAVTQKLTEALGYAIGTYKNDTPRSSRRSWQRHGAGPLLGARGGEVRGEAHRGQVQLVSETRESRGREVILESGTRDAGAPAGGWVGSPAASRKERVLILRARRRREGDAARAPGGPTGRASPRACDSRDEGFLGAQLSQL